MAFSASHVQDISRLNTQPCSFTWWQRIADGSGMSLFIVSDIHLGSPYCKHRLFSEFLDALPTGSTLILNGDTIDNPNHRLNDDARQLLDHLLKTAERINGIWVEGNHDQECRPADSGHICFTESYSVGDNQLFVTHGSYFDNVMPYHRWFIQLFRFLHTVRLRLGAPPVHVAEYAKKWRFLYQYLNKTVMMNAIEYAKENGYGAVACGHVHHLEHTVVDGIEYLNTGAWTELPVCYISVSDSTVSLLEWRGSGEEPVLRPRTALQPASKGNRS
jgi:UDP-2,3-diacylglucosamine pyrophosphatase LpxH